MIEKPRYEVISLVLEFFLSLVVLVGSGFLLLKGVATEIAVSSITAVLSFWFLRRQAEASRGPNPGPTAQEKPQPKPETDTKQEP